MTMLYKRLKTPFVQLMNLHPLDKYAPTRRIPLRKNMTPK